MRLGLICHPGSYCAAVSRVEVEVARPRADSLVLAYGVTGAIGDIRMPPVSASTRSDELWRHTCFEAFIGVSPGDGYYEFNVAPSTQWAAYRFTGYRCGMAVAEEIGAPVIAVQSDPERYTLQVMLALDRLSGLRRGAPWRLGLSAVIEESRGQVSYWALAHPPGKPDFHHADGFAHEISPA